MTSPPKSRSHVPETGLARLANQPGGKSRDEALIAADKSIESLREGSVEGIEAAFKEIEAIARSMPAGDLSIEQLTAILLRTDRIITLAGTFGFVRLDSVARGLGDLTNALLEATARPAAPILVHIHAAQLFSPRAEAIPEADAQQLLVQLRKVRERFVGTASGAQLA